MVFWNQKKSGKEIAQELNQDKHKAEWLQKVLSPKEFSDFVLAQGTSLLYYVLLKDKEPKRKRSPEMKNIMNEFTNDVKEIIENHTQASISERVQQIEELIRNAQFMEENIYTPSIYYYFRTFSDDQRRDWDKRMNQIDEEIFGIDFSIFED